MNATLQGIKIDWLGNVYAIDGKRRIGAFICGPNRDGTYTIRMHHEDSPRNYPASHVAIQWNQGLTYVAADGAL